MVAVPSTAAARRSLAAWAVRASNGRWQPARHLLYLAGLLERFERGEIKRLAVSMPPRHGKSVLIEQYYPSWHLGRHQRDEVMLVSYGETLTVGWSREARDALAEHGPAVFGVQTNTRASTAEWHLFDSTTRARTGGRCYAVGIDGTITGRGADRALFDDLFKDSITADSPTMRDRVWSQLTSAVLTRLSPTGAAAGVGTRWHHDDHFGRLEAMQARGEGGEPWTFVNLPALAIEGEPDPLGRKPGEALWPERFPRERLEQIRAEVGPRVWQCLYQGRPTALEGALFRREWLNRYAHVDEAARTVTIDGTTRPLEGVAFATVDVATSTKTHGDYTAIGCFLWIPAAQVLVLLDVVRERLEAPQLAARLAGLVDRWGLRAVFVEKVAHQLAVMQLLRAERLPIREVVADRDKVSRALPVTAALEGGWLRFRAGQPWLGELERELVEFPSSAKDDQVDMLGYAVRVALAWRRGEGGGAGGRYVPTPKGPSGGWRIGR